MSFYDFAIELFDFDGGIASADCSTYGGDALCGAGGSPVAMQGLSCTGEELSVKECSWSAPSSACSSHAQDAVVFCSAGEPVATEGTLRLISTDGAPASTGRLEVLLGGILTRYTLQAGSPVTCRPT